MIEHALLDRIGIGWPTFALTVDSTRGAAGSAITFDTLPDGAARSWTRILTQFFNTWTASALAEPAPTGAVGRDQLGHEQRQGYHLRDDRRELT